MCSVIFPESLKGILSYTSKVTHGISKNKTNKQTKETDNSNAKNARQNVLQVLGLNLLYHTKQESIRNCVQWRSGGNGESERKGCSLLLSQKRLVGAGIPAPKGGPSQPAS